jgi:cyclopropane fatty-acyl-phospholipid synthase-like methyltransferase
MMQEGMEHLDLGCGWGAMALHATGKYKVKTTGITLAQEQANYIAERDTENRCNIKVMNFWDLDEKENYKKFDVITCLEMSEHIGIRDYQAFVHKVRNMLKDDGVFYLQIAGLRRNWQYEDCIWALFMNKYIFPGADASCPLYWDVEQLERGGFEIRNVENMGPHYCLSIYSWYLNWRKNKAAVVAKYGEWLWRNYAVFLTWSYLIGNQGSSTVWMIRMNKALPHDARSRTQPAALAGNKGNAFGMERANWMVDEKLR